MDLNPCNHRTGQPWVKPEHDGSSSLVAERNHDPGADPFMRLVALDGRAKLLAHHADYALAEPAAFGRRAGIETDPVILDDQFQRIAFGAPAEDADLAGCAFGIG